MRHIVLTVAAAGLALSGCTGSSTYGTGKTQEQHLVEGVTGLFSLKTTQAKRIDYEERPALVKPAQPRLVEPVSRSADENFPLDPEAARLAARNDSRVDPVTGQFTAEFASSRKTNSNPQLRRDDGLTVEERQMEELSPGWKIRHDKEGQARRRAQIAEANGTSVGTGPRKYLTQPPTAYRTPYETAPVGDVGQTEKSKEFKKKNKDSLLSKLNPFD